MFIRQVKKQRSKSSKIFYQYTLAQAARVDGKVKQRAILYLGSDPLLADKVNRAVVLRLLKTKIFGVIDLHPQNDSDLLVKLAQFYYEKYCLKYGQDQESLVSIPPAVEKAEFHTVDIKTLEVKDVKSFGAEHLCTQMLDKLGLKECLQSCGLDKNQISTALISIAAKAIFSCPEHKTAQILSLNSELPLCFGHERTLTHKHLYAAADLLYKHKKQIDEHIHQRVTTMFGLQDKLVIFDISNTYFETRKPNSKIAKHGRSKEKRTDCPLVVFTGVINAEGFIRHSKIYEGNTPDTATLSDIIEDLNSNASSTTIPTIVMDAGIATEDNIALINEKGYNYVCVSRKRLKDYPRDSSTPRITQLTDRAKNKVELAVFEPEGYSDTWMYVQSEAKREKEQSMDIKLRQRFEQDIATIKKAITTKGVTKNIDKVWERIGRIKQKHNRVSAQYEVQVSQQGTIATKLELKKKLENKIKEDKAQGVYFIRTNLKAPTETQVWDIYNTIREVESTFRCLKSDLNIRPVHHQKDERIESHIYLTILAYQLVNTIRHMLKDAQIHYDWKNIVRIMSTQSIQTIELQTDKKQIHLRKPAKPIEQVQQIYKATQCTNTQKAVKKYVVYH